MGRDYGPIVDNFSGIFFISGIFFQHGSNTEQAILRESGFKETYYGFGWMGRASVTLRPTGGARGTYWKLLEWPISYLASTHAFASFVISLS